MQRLKGPPSERTTATPAVATSGEEARLVAREALEAPQGAMVGVLAVVLAEGAQATVDSLAVAAGDEGLTAAAAEHAGERPAKSTELPSPLSAQLSAKACAEEGSTT